MKPVYRVFEFDGLVPPHFTPRRLRTLRKLVVIALVAAFPATYFSYHHDRLQPVVDKLTDSLLEAVVPESEIQTELRPEAEPQ